MTFSNPPTQPSRENSILILKASLKVINHDKNDSLYFVFIQYASQYYIYFATTIAENNYQIFDVIKKVLELGQVQAKMTANVCTNLENNPMFNHFNILPSRRCSFSGCDALKQWKKEIIFQPNIQELGHYINRNKKLFATTLPGNLQLMTKNKSNARLKI